MSDAIQTALGGMQTTAAKADEAATKIVRSSFTTPVAAPAPTTQPASSASSLASTPAVINDTGKGHSDNALQGVTEFQQAARAYEASLKAVETLHKLQQTLVEALGWVLPEDSQKAS